MGKCDLLNATTNCAAARSQTRDPFGQEMGYEISTSQMQHDAADKKKHNKIQASYTLEGTVLENVDIIKYLGVTITSDLKWNSHIRNVCSKANRTLGFLRRNLFSCPKDVKEA